MIVAVAVAVAAVFGQTGRYQRSHEVGLCPMREVASKGKLVAGARTALALGLKSGMASWTRSGGVVGRRWAFAAAARCQTVGRRTHTGSRSTGKAYPTTWLPLILDGRSRR